MQKAVVDADDQPARRPGNYLAKAVRKEKPTPHGAEFIHPDLDQPAYPTAYSEGVTLVAMMYGGERVHDKRLRRIVASA